MVKKCKVNTKIVIKMIFYVNIIIDQSKGVDSLAKKEEKNPVGRPKLADSESIKKSWFMIGASLVIVFVLVVCGTGVLTSRTPLEVLTFKKAKASVVRTDDITIKRIKAIDNDEIKVKKKTFKIIFYQQNSDTVGNIDELSDNKTEAVGKVV